ncbi:MAG TPA: TetR/AcrR family transcriptional regulator [Candidatus Dormibacteraeota bacterium]|nr:TetR/AcrR family transcriptional regulator [Candidatus Dormibacteraeota bacterium]
MRGRRGATAPESGAASASTRARIVAATAAALREEGFAGTSARSIARHGGFNQSLIFYHFGGLTDLLVATLEELGAQRLQEYSAAMAGVPDIATAVAVAKGHYEADVRTGHITVLAELIAGASSVPELGPELVRCTAPWLGLAEETIGRLLRGTAAETLVPPRDAAVALLVVYLGMELLDHLDPDAHVGAPLFDIAERLLAVAGPLLRPRPAPHGSAARTPRRVVIDGPPDTEDLER